MKKRVVKSSDGKNRLVWVVSGVVATVAIIGIGTVLMLSKSKTAPLSEKTPVAEQPPTLSPSPSPSLPPAEAPSGFGDSVAYEAPNMPINSAIAKDFSVREIKNIADMEQAYGITFSTADLKTLQDRKFLMKNLLDTSIRPMNVGYQSLGREFVSLYDGVKGLPDPRDRNQANAVFFSSDVFFNTYNTLYVELLKEMENKEFYPSMLNVSKTFYEQSTEQAKAATTDAEKQKWTKLRMYFAVPYAILKTAAQPPSQFGDGSTDPAKAMTDYQAKDAKIDTYVATAAFLKTLKLDSASEQTALADLKTIFDASGLSAPAVFEKEYADYQALTGVDFKVDFTQFTPRGTYTSSSLRRQYFRAMKWYIMLPFFVKSPDLTTYAYGVADLMAQNPQALASYNRLESAIKFMVGTSDDLMPVDYLQALAAGKGAVDPSAAAMEYLVKARNPKIKDVAAGYTEIGKEQSAAVLLNTKGMRFFSGKFIIDSYWTGYMTQGDEAPRPGYTQKLPPMASSLEVMSLLGSDYAKTQIPKLDFYTDKTKEAITKALSELEAEQKTFTDADWKANLYTEWMWTIKGLFSWLQENRAMLPAFMQSVAWDAKTLQTAAGFWTELRHATILYAKQSFTELGAGGGECDRRPIPAPPKGYIEPQPLAYARLSYLAKRTSKGLIEQGFNLTNLEHLNNFIYLMDTVQSSVGKELGNATLTEHVTSTTGPDYTDPEKTCTEFLINGTSDWENLRLKIVEGLSQSLPTPVEGDIISAKDRRAAVVADVHTGGDTANPHRILYEGTGVPYVIFTAVSDANGPRLTVGFTYAQYEFTKLYGGQRMTDEDWQKTFYDGTDASMPFIYTDKATWPKPNAWYAPLFESVK